MASEAEQYMSETYRKFQNSNGLDSSESSDSQENDPESAQQDESKPTEGVRNRKHKKREQSSSESTALEQQDTPHPKPKANQQGELSKCWSNSKKAMKKTVSFQIFPDSF